MKLLITLALLATVTAIPNGEYFEDRVPETDLIDISYDPAKEAQATITALIQEGKDEGACDSLANAAIKEITDTVEAQQKILDGLPTGNDCDKEGQEGLDAAKKALTDAQSEKGDAGKAIADAQAAPVEFPPMSLDSLVEGQCGVFFSDGAYTAAKKNLEDAQKRADQADGAETAAQNALSTATEARKAAVNECYCETKAAYDKAWEAANANNDANAKAYAKAKHMECALKGTAPEDCDVGEIPKPKSTESNLHADVASCHISFKKIYNEIKISHIKKLGWTQCYNFDYKDTLKSLPWKKCTGSYILEGCGTIGSSVLKVAAAGKRSDVFHKECATRDWGVWTDYIGFILGKVPSYRQVGSIGWYCGPEDVRGKRVDGGLVGNLGSFGFSRAEDANKIKVTTGASIPGGINVISKIGREGAGWSCDGDKGYLANNGKNQVLVFEKN